MEYRIRLQREGMIQQHGEGEGGRTQHRQPSVCQSSHQGWTGGERDGKRAKQEDGRLQQNPNTSRHPKGTAFDCKDETKETAKESRQGSKAPKIGRPKTLAGQVHNVSKIAPKMKPTKNEEVEDKKVPHHLPVSRHRQPFVHRRTSNSLHRKPRRN